MEWAAGHGNSTAQQWVADANGDVWEAAVDSNAELVDMIETARMYQNNVQVLNTAKSLMLETIRIGK